MDRRRHDVLITIASRPRRGEPVGADAWQLAWHETSCRLAFVDGAGPGLATANTAAAAVRALAREPRLRPGEAIARCHDALRGSPGASIFVARIDAPSRRIEIAAAGGVVARLYRNGECLDVPVNRGSAGGSLGWVDAVDLEIGTDWLLLAHTDGIGDGATALPYRANDVEAAAAAKAALTAVIHATTGATALMVHPR